MEELQNISVASFVNSEDIWGLKGYADLLIFLSADISFDHGIKFGHVHFTFSGTNILLQFSWMHLPLPHACQGFSDTCPGPSMGTTQHLWKPGSVRGNRWPAQDRSKMVDACPIVSFEWTYLRCILPGFQIVPEGSGPSSPLITAVTTDNKLCMYWLPLFPYFSHPSLPFQFPEITSQNKLLLHTNPCFSLCFLEGIMAKTPSERNDDLSF